MSSNIALRRSRTTADAHVAVKMAAKESEVHPAVLFDAYANADTEKLVESADFSILPPFQGKPLSKSLDDLHEAFAKDTLEELHEEAIITAFKTYLHSIITPGIRDEMVAFWPPVVPTDEPIDVLTDRNAAWRKELRAAMKPKERTAIERVVMPELEP